jgi:cyclase
MTRPSIARPAIALAAAALVCIAVAPPALAKKLYLGPAPGASYHVHGVNDSIPVIEVHRLKPGVYAARFNFVWVGWVELPEGLLLIDSGNSARGAKALADTIRARSPGRPFRYLVNTHGHSDHVAGDRYFSALGAEIVAQDSSVAEIEETIATEVIPAPGDSPQPFQPRWRRVSHRATFGKAPRLVQVLWLGHPAHTAGDLVVYLPRQRIIFSGDLASYQSVPWMLDRAMDVDGWRTSIDSLLSKSFPADSLVPGHGWITTPTTALQFTRTYLTDLVSKAKKEASYGTSLASIRDWGDLGSFQSLEFYDEVHFLNLRRLYNEALGRKSTGRTRPGAFYIH